MAITTAFANTFKKELFEGRHLVRSAGNGGQVFKMALYLSSADLGASDTVYKTDGEVSGVGYTAGGQNLVASDPVVAGSAGIATFNNVVWTSATFTAGGCMIYNSEYNNACCSTHTFNGDITANNGDFTVVMPNFTETDALWRMV